MKQIIIVLALMLWIIGFIGGTAYCLSVNQPVSAIACIVNGILAFPTIIHLWKKVKE